MYKLVYEEGHVYGQGQGPCGAGMSKGKDKKREFIYCRSLV